MNATLAISALLGIMLASCAAATPTPQVAMTPEVTKVSTEVQLPTTAPPATPIASTAIPAPTEADTTFGPATYQYFVRVQTFHKEIEHALGVDFLDMHIYSIAFSPDGRLVAAGGCTQSWSGSCINPDMGPSQSFIFILDALTGTVLSALPETQVTISALAFNGDGSLLAYAVNPDRIAIWNVAAERIDTVIWEAEGSPSRRLAISPDGHLLAEVDGTTLRVWDIASGDLLAEMPGRNFGSDLPRFSKDGSKFAVYSDQFAQKITIYEVDGWAELAVIELPEPESRLVAMAEDLSLVASAERYQNTGVLLLDGTTGEELARLQDPNWRTITGLGITPDARLLLISSLPIDDDYDYPIGVWDLETQTRLGKMAGPGDEISQIRFAQDGRSFQRGLGVWSVADEKVIAVRRAVTDYLNALSEGDYEAAAVFYHPYEDDVDYVESLGVDSSDEPAMLEFLCTREANPCLAMEEIIYAGKEPQGEYGLLIHFLALDGSTYEDFDGYRGSWIYADLQADGSVTTTFLPPIY